ncbi:MAG: [FeFe] hydrogenase H-cluster radical SAM maturase HydE [Armatimonadetes bacterium]|nr:[FeFe] hydrogenase H-cluster radical SAM maturase HydE [Armatimonadota bacterium]
MNSLLNKCIESGNIGRDEIIFLLGLQGEDTVRLIRAANEVRQRYCGDEVHIRGLVEFSNTCRNDCLYCGIRRSNTSVRRYRMTPDEIVATATGLAKRGIGTVVLQSGEDSHYSGETVAEIVRSIKASADVAVTLSLGERSFADYALWRQAGADRYLLRHETANPALFEKIHPDSTLERRLSCLRGLRRLGYQIGAGCMVGIPGQTLEDLADDILLLRALEVDMAGIGPFIPHPGTPFAGEPAGSLDLTLKMVALARIVTRDALIPATTATGSIDEFGREKALEAGANVVMPNHTPFPYRVDYEIYPNKRCVTEDPNQCGPCLTARIFSIDRTAATGKGHSPRHLRAQAYKATKGHGCPWSL